MLSSLSIKNILIVSILGSVAGSLFMLTLHFMITFLDPGKNSSSLQIWIMVFIGVLVALIKKFIGNPGDINLLLDNIHVSGGRANFREIKSLIPTSLLCISSGGAMGPEAPLVQTTAAIGTFFGKKNKLTTSQLRVLTISGMATGFSMLFGTPIGATIFSLEIMHRKGFEYYEAVIPALMGSLVGYAITAGCFDFGLKSIWSIGTIKQTTMMDMVWGGVAGILGASIGVFFVFLVRFQKKLFSYLPDWIVPILGGTGLGLLGLWNTYALTYGETQLTSLFDNSMTWKILLFAGIAKLMATSLTLSSNWKGGFIIPLFFIGAAFGQIISNNILALPLTLIFTLSMMVAVNTSVTKTPIGSTLVVCGMCGFPAFAPCLLAGMISLMISNRIVFFDAQRSRIA